MTGRTWRVAVVGSGPSGIYAATSLLKHEDPPIHVDVYDRLPTPYGLVRYGVAPDHPNIKSIVSVLQTALEHDRARYVGCVELGKDISREDLVAHYDAVIYATGASIDRAMGIPGEDLPGSYPATDFVAWYSGHPDAVQPFPLDTITSVVVVGVGNVALDVARMLAKTPDDLATTDTSTPVLRALATSTVREVHIVGRRGPEHAKFTTKELRELNELANASVAVVPSEVEVDPDVEHPKLARQNLGVLIAWAAQERVIKPRHIDVRFWLRPAEILGTDKVTALRCERTAAGPDGSVRGTGEYIDIAADVVLRAVGYRSLPLPGVPFDEDAGTVPHDAGRVLGPDGAPLPGEYVAGWLKRGPTGVIGTNKSDASETVRSLLEDLTASGVRAELPDVDSLLAGCGAEIIDYTGWLRIDAEELARGAAEQRERAKINDWETLRKVGRG